MTTREWHQSCFGGYQNAGVVADIESKGFTLFDWSVFDTRNSAPAMDPPGPGGSHQREAPNTGAGWKDILLLPVLLVTSLWIVMSLGTTAYLQWVESEYDRVFTENLTSIDSARQVESLIWKSVSGWSDPAQSEDQLALRLEAAKQELNVLVTRIRNTAHTEDERAAAKSLAAAAATMTSILSSAASISRTTQERSPETMSTLLAEAGRLSHFAEVVRTINQDLIQAARQRLKSARSFVMILRMAMLLLGPLMGVLLGWKTARKLRTSVARIAVTLSGASSMEEAQEFTVSITPGNSIDDVRRQAERVVERLRSVGRELQAARREVIQSERLAAVGELAAGVAHELRNPLTSVKLLLQHAARPANALRISESQLKLILHEIGRMESTIQGLLDLSRRPALHRVVHDLRETVHRSLVLADGRLRQNHVQLTNAQCPEPLWIDGDAEQLNQVFVNLLLNSIEAVPEGGTIRVESRRGPRQTAQVLVTDSGPGIPEEMKARLFEPFATTKERGTGLGLAISHRIISDHHGVIQPECSGSGPGTTFMVELPLCAEPRSLEEV